MLQILLLSRYFLLLSLGSTPRMCGLPTIPPFIAIGTPYVLRMGAGYPGYRLRGRSHLPY